MKPDIVDESNIEMFQREAEIMHALDHEHVAKFYEYNRELELTLPNGETSQAVAIIQEYCNGGDLFEFISMTGCFHENLARYFFLQLWNAILHLQAKGFSHRDLKCENLMLNTEFELKIIDFGYSSIFNKATTQLGKFANLTL